jgi:ketosteroid isomerase-like protein
MDKPETQAILKQYAEWTNQRHSQYWDKTQNGQTRDTGNRVIRCRMDKPETHAVLRQDTKWTSQRQRQYWDMTHNGQAIDTCSINTIHRMDKPETQTHLATRLPVSLVCPFCVLFQYCLCLWFVHFAYCFNIACVSGLSILCLVPKRHRQSCSKMQNGQTRDTCSIKTRNKMDKPETEAVLRQDVEWTNQRHRQYWDKTHNGQTRDTGNIETICRMDKPETQAVLRQDTEWTN